ncbi:MAG: alpha-glucan family phosphorylase [Deltaproteobacteria bacterium]|nr:alpha-glucan family phosphorylase [Deltaproteobacteria bacterium]
MSTIKTFSVFPKVPASLSFLVTLSRNLWWSWQRDAVELFRRIDPRRWDESHGNPLLFSTMVSQERLEELAADESFLAHLQRVEEAYQREVEAPQDFSQTPYKEKNCIAYFSMEFGIHESLPLFAGGLGVLAGDHLKASSDLCLPLVAVGLLYRHGYFHQYLDQNGWQQEGYLETDLFYLPIHTARNQAGEEVRIAVSGPEGEIRARVWQVRVGRIALYLLDTNIPENPPEIRNITSKLYDGEMRIRLAQEILLGIGGIRALNALGINAKICHMNEGHSAFSVLARLAHCMRTHQVDLSTAMEIVPRTTVFTTHTPVAAGHDEFPAHMVRPYLEPVAAKLGTAVEEILSLGQSPGAGPEAPFSMSILGLRLSQYHNGVSELHGKVARRMWAHAWPGRPEDEIPITHVTNGIHITSWISHQNFRLFENYLGPEWHLQPTTESVVDKIDEIYDEELWNAHQMCRSRLITTCRRLMIKQYEQRNAPKSIMEYAESVLDQDILTIGFARRFATYKRATLLFQDPDRLEALINSPTRPVQFIFAGKAHPKDNEGKELIRRIIEFANRPAVRHRVVFLEDYDINIARYLVRGCDVWLNTPRRPYEACGTSGMKAAINGVLNFSVLDGWWCEGYREDRGWRIGRGEEYDDPHYQDMVESQALYNILENDVIPCFYERKDGTTPTRWIKMMKESMKMAMRDFCSIRMVNEYQQRFYLPIAARHDGLVADRGREARELLARHQRLHRLWHQLSIKPPVRQRSGSLVVGETVEVTAEAFLGELQPEEVAVELYYGPLQSLDRIHPGFTEIMEVRENLGDGRYLYACTIECEVAGRYGFTARITPAGDELLKFDPDFITWA